MQHLVISIAKVWENQSNKPRVALWARQGFMEWNACLWRWCHAHLLKKKLQTGASVSLAVHWPTSQITAGIFHDGVLCAFTCRICVRERRDWVTWEVKVHHLMHRHKRCNPHKVCAKCEWILCWPSVWTKCVQSGDVSHALLLLFLGLVCGTRVTVKVYFFCCGLQDSGWHQSCLLSSKVLD